MSVSPVDADTVRAVRPQDAPARRMRARTARRFLRNKLATAGLVFLLLLVVVAIAAPLIAPFDPDAQVLVERFQPPSGAHWLGTDSLGRDILSRLIFGTRVSLIAGLEALAVAAVIGVLLGLIAGFVGRKVDSVLSLINDALMSVPGLILALAIIAVLGAGLTNSMLAVGLTMSPRFYRLTRITTRGLRNDTFIEASTAMGCSRRRIIGVHILPNVLPPLIVQATFVFASAVLAEASLSFLGLGVSPPTASWGAMLSDASERLDLSYLIWGPGVALSLSVIAFMAIGDGWRDAIGLDREDGQ
ncbi:MAG TPA: ABC transporter permease [Amycolatopsis sp.]|nr:ABC transporter permease [Amycolatopsis sp.]